MERCPAFQFYPADWLADYKVKRLSREAKSDYFEVLCHMWHDSDDQSTFPLDTKSLAGIWGLTPEEAVDAISVLLDPSCPMFRVVRRQGVEYLQSKRFAKEKKRISEYHEKQSAAGKKGAERRWGKPDGVAIRGAIGVPMAKDSSSTSSSTSTASSSAYKNKPLSLSIEEERTIACFCEKTRQETLTAMQTASLVLLCRKYGSAQTRVKVSEVSGQHNARSLIAVVTTALKSDLQ